MPRSLRLSLLAGTLLLAASARGSDNLPRLSAGGPESLPSVNNSPQSMAVTPDRSLPVTCYLGNPNDNNRQGSIVATSPEAAGPSCNSINYACQGRCFGCYADFDLSEDICVDSAGRKFIR